MVCFLGKFLCGVLIGHTGGAEPQLPSVAGVQAAFDREAIVADGKHDRDLKITGLECMPDQAKYFCQVNFVRTEQASGQVYLDAALIERRDDGDWKLLKGLCRRLI
jgi:hypothetical protein